MNMLGDLHVLETGDGETFVIDDPWFFPVYGGYGAPPINYETRRGYRQHGVTEIDFFLQPRTITIEIYRVGVKDRAYYWQIRNELLDFLRPNRGPLTLTLVQAGGTQRSIIVRPDPGPPYAARPVNENNWDISEPLTFVAFDPAFFDPIAIEFDPVASEDENLVFPITFPILFGVSGTFFTTGNLNYAGTWKTYPIITLVGPYSTVEITNSLTGVVFGLNIPIAAGVRRIIQLQPGQQSVTDHNGANRFSELTAGSNLVDFAIVPTSEPQALRCRMINGDANISAFRVSYNTRYIGV